MCQPPLAPAATDPNMARMGWLWLWLGWMWTAAAQQISAAPPPEPVGVELPLPPEGWTTVQATYLELHGPPQRMELLLRLSRHGSEVLPELAEALDVPIGRTIHVYVADSDERFRTLQPGTAPTWADATAYPSLGAVFLRDPRVRVAVDEPLEQVFDHELVHVLLGRAFAPRRPPAWLQEGVAQILAHQTDPTTISRTLSSASARGTLPTLRALEAGFPHDPMRARAAYAQSADFVQYLMVEHGEQVVPQLVRHAVGGADLRGAVQRATDQSLDDVEAAWRSRWTQRTGMAAAVLGSIGEWVFGLGAVALLVGGVMRRRRFRRRLQEMEEEEALVDALVEQMRRRRTQTSPPP
ncbi:MAG: hypothetical protein KTR31_04795 [Myxococcales bacterium]|nr:hypothetical protein [Myxococcales bacterium]